jgi:hypothetical protein
VVYRFDKRHKAMGSLLAALIVVALVVPACMTLACLDTPMSGHGQTGGMKLVDCLATGALHDGLLAAGTSTLGAVMILSAALVGLVLAVSSSVPLVRMGWVLAPVAAGPPPPLNPRGERLLI